MGECVVSVCLVFPLFVLVGKGVEGRRKRKSFESKWKPKNGLQGLASICPSSL